MIGISRLVSADALAVLIDVLADGLAYALADVLTC